MPYALSMITNNSEPPVKHVRRKNATVHVPTEKIHEEGSREFKGSTISFGPKKSKGIMQMHGVGQLGKGERRKRVF